MLPSKSSTPVVHHALSPTKHPSSEPRTPHSSMSTTGPWMKRVLLPEQQRVLSPISPPIFGVQPMFRQSTFLSAGVYGPALPSIPLPPRSPSPVSSASSYDPTSPPSFPHPLLRPNNIRALVSSQFFSPDMISVPQDLMQYRFSEDAFLPVQNRIKIRFTGHKKHHLVLESPRPSVELVLRAIYDHLHCALARQSLVELGESRQRTAMASFEARRTRGGDVSQGIKLLDVAGFGAHDVYFAGLSRDQDANTNTWTAIFVFERRA